MNTQRHDTILMEILQERQTVVGFLQSVFGFLARCTDFYHEMKVKEDNIGFPRGFKEQLVLKVIKQFEPNTEHHIDKVPSATNEVEVVTEEIVSSVDENVNINQMNIDEDQVDESKQQQTEQTNSFQLNEFHNGAKFNNYCWSQTINDIEIHVILPSDITSSKDLKITIKSDEIVIFNKQSNKIILEGKFYGKCKNNDAVWSMSEKKLQINLDKIKSCWWHKLLLQEDSIDLSKMDCSRELHELPQEDQATIQRLKWDHQQEMLGLPTSRDIENRDLLKQAWDVEGSPFKGQPFDPSLVKFE
ncbi:nudC domain-containing protein 3-like [Condylostylus longicornis]|uniref:nudC domain-containing protein 3-like n=1 Tax=Condylostylus longicornis TaxID=2530218 RepID=UPI00244DD207|nr:nudC domain-containing protein 3-like [Condylostylus longicornis]